MDKDNLSPDDVEQLLAELAPDAEHARRRNARMEQSRQQACRAARSEINRVFFRGYCIRAAEYATVLCLLGGALSLLWTAEGEKQEAPLAKNDIPMPVAVEAPVAPDEPEAELAAEEIAIVVPPAPAVAPEVFPEKSPYAAPTAATADPAAPAAGLLAGVPKDAPVRNAEPDSYVPCPEDDSSALAMNERGAEMDDGVDDDLAFSEQVATEETASDADRLARAKTESMPSAPVCRAPKAQDLAMADKLTGVKMRAAKLSLNRSVAADKSMKPAATDRDTDITGVAPAKMPDSALKRLSITVAKTEIKGDEALVTLAVHNAGKADMTIGHTPQSLKETACIRSPKWSTNSYNTQHQTASDDKKQGSIVVPAGTSAQLTITFYLRVRENAKDAREKLLNKLRRAEVQFTFTYFKFGKSEWIDIFHKKAPIENR